MFLVGKFVKALASDGAIDDEGLSNMEIQQVYGPITQQINESLAKQESVMSQIQVKYLLEQT